MKVVRQWLAQALDDRSRVRILALERELQELHLDLKEKVQQIDVLKGALDRRDRTQKFRVESSVHLQTEQLLASVAVPVAQLHTQLHLAKAEGQRVAVRDVLAIVRRLLHTLQDAGLELDGHIGESVPFDPNRQELLHSGEAVPGESVVVRTAGVVYRGKVLHKAGVEKAGE